MYSIIYRWKYDEQEKLRFQQFYKIKINENTWVEKKMYVFKLKLHILTWIFNKNLSLWSSRFHEVMIWKNCWKVAYISCPNVHVRYILVIPTHTHKVYEMENCSIIWTSNQIFILVFIIYHRFSEALVSFWAVKHFFIAPKKLP